MNKVSAIEIYTNFVILQTNVVVIISLKGTACNVPSSAANWSNFYTLPNQYRAPQNNVCSVCMFSTSPKPTGLIQINQFRTIQIWNNSDTNANYVWGNIVYWKEHDDFNSYKSKYINHDTTGIPDSGGVLSSNLSRSEYQVLFSYAGGVVVIPYVTTYNNGGLIKYKIIDIVNMKPVTGTTIEVESLLRCIS